MNQAAVVRAHAEIRFSVDSTLTPLTGREPVPAQPAGPRRAGDWPAPVVRNRHRQVRTRALPSPVAPVARARSFRPEVSRAPMAGSGFVSLLNL